MVSGADGIGVDRQATPCMGRCMGRILALCMGAWLGDVEMMYMYIKWRHIADMF